MGAFAGASAALDCPVEYDACHSAGEDWSRRRGRYSRRLCLLVHLDDHGAVRDGGDERNAAQPATPLGRGYEQAFCGRGGELCFGRLTLLRMVVLTLAQIPFEPFSFKVLLQDESMEL